MSAAPGIISTELVALQKLSIEDLEEVLDEERLTWRSQLSWDFAPSADLVRRFVRIKALHGYALRVEGKVVGYSYYVCEERKGIVGDLYLLRAYANTQNEDYLLGAILDDLTSSPVIERIEAQLMMLHGPFERHMPRHESSDVFPRLFMIADLSAVGSLPPAHRPFQLEHWDESKQEEAALLISSSYQGHVDGSINDQYRSYSGAKRFLNNIVQYPGCGSFSPPSSMVAVLDGRMIGVVLSSLVANDTGHVTQVCVAPEQQGKGVGYELMRQALLTLQAEGCEKVSLTVTASNASAIGLYNRMGFRAVRRFAAYVWSDF